MTVKGDGEGETKEDEKAHLIPRHETPACARLGTAQQLPAASLPNKPTSPVIFPFMFFGSLASSSLPPEKQHQPPWNPFRRVARHRPNVS